MGTIQRKTGEGRDAIESYLGELTEAGAAGVSKAVDAARQYAGNVREYASNVADSAHEGARYAADQVRAGYSEAERMVRGRPGSSLAIALGVGIIAGMLVGFSMRSR